VLLIAVLALTRVATAGVEASYRGEVQAKQADVVARVAGAIRGVSVHDRQSVKQGDLLVVLDDTDLQARLAAAKAELAAKQAELAARPSDRLADARVKQAEAAVQLAQLELAHATIHAELAGTIALRGIAAGQRVQPQQTLATIVDVDHAWIDAYFQEPQLAQVAVGQAVEVAVGGATLHGVVTGIDRDGAAMVHAIADPTHGKVGVRVQIELRDKRSGLWPGMTASVRIHTP
jgi:multidrug resistance efflux pump